MKNYLEKTLQEANINYDYSSMGEGKHSYHFIGNFEDFQTDISISIYENEGYWFYYIIYPYEIPQERIHQVAEYITRLNYGDVFGAFIIDYVGSVVGYHLSSHISEVQEEAENWFEGYLAHGRGTVEECHAGLLKVFDGTEPKTVLKEMGFVTNVLG